MRRHGVFFTVLRVLQWSMKRYIEAQINDEDDDGGSGDDDAGGSGGGGDDDDDDGGGGGGGSVDDDDGSKMSKAKQIELFVLSKQEIIIKGLCQYQKDI